MFHEEIIAFMNSTNGSITAHNQTLTVQNSMILGLHNRILELERRLPKPDIDDYDAYPQEGEWV